MQLSKHFKLEEMTKSMTATRKGIDNSPGAGDIKNLEKEMLIQNIPVACHGWKTMHFLNFLRSKKILKKLNITKK